MAQKHKIVIIGAGFGGVTMSKFFKKKYVKDMLSKSTNELNKIDAPLLNLVRALYPVYKKQKAKYKN